MWLLIPGAQITAIPGAQITAIPGAQITALMHTCDTKVFIIVQYGLCL